MNLDEHKNDLTTVIERFRQLLRASWGVVAQQFSWDDELKHDWLQVNWELIVEGALTNRERAVRLSSYGDGAEGISDRVFLSHLCATHEVKCFSKIENSIKDHLNDVMLLSPDDGFTFYRFVSLDENGWYVEAPPFDMVQVRELDDSVFNYHDFRFELSAIE